MGGLGSTRWSGHRRRTTVEEVFLGLSLRELARHGIFAPWERHGTLSWVAQPAQMGWRLEWTDDGALLTLKYQLRMDNKPDRVVESAVRFGMTRLPSGGMRRWFLCPTCARRTTLLYLPRAEAWFGCRPCHRLRYRSQRRAGLDRLRDRAVKAWRRLGNDDDPQLHLRQLPPLKPKGMHWRTYERLVAEYEARRREWEVGFVRMAVSFLHGSGVSESR